MAKQLREFIPKIAARGIVGAPDGIVEDIARDVAIDLCERGLVWPFTTSHRLQSCVAEYPLLLPNGTTIVALDQVRYNGSNYRALPGMKYAQCGRTTRVFVPNDIQIIIEPPLEPAYPGSDEMLIDVWLAPTRDATMVSDALFEHYVDTIADGMASRLFLMPKQEWSNLGLGQRYSQMYEVKLGRAKNKRVMERTAGPLMMTGSYF